MATAFKIENYDVRDTVIKVFLIHENISIQITIDKNHFETFVNVKPTEYYRNTADATFKTDLLNYIKSHPIEYRGVDYTDAVKSITDAFDDHRKSKHLLNP